MSQDVVAKYHALSNEDLFPLGEKALKDIADDIIVLYEIRQRFYAAKGSPLLGYQNWREFVERNSKYSIRTIQNRIAEVQGKDESKVNDRYKERAKVQYPVENYSDINPETGRAYNQLPTHQEIVEGTELQVTLRDDDSEGRQGGNRGHGMAMTRWRDLAKSLGYKLGVANDNFILSKDGKKINLGMHERGLREFLRKEQADLNPACQPVTEPFVPVASMVDGKGHATCACGKNVRINGGRYGSHQSEEGHCPRSGKSVGVCVDGWKFPLDEKRPNRRDPLEFSQIQKMALTIIRRGFKELGKDLEEVKDGSGDSYLLRIAKDWLLAKVQSEAGLLPPKGEEEQC
jgi:hypothetical protein